MAVGGCLAQWDKRHHTTPKSRVRAPVSSLGPLLTIYHRQGRRRGGHRMPDHHQPGDFLHGFADEATKSHSVAYSRSTDDPPSVPCVLNLARPLRLFRARPLPPVPSACRSYAPPDMNYRLRPLLTPPPPSLVLQYYAMVY